MPIYEFYCASCHTLYNFLARTLDPSRRPRCPRCGREDLERRISAFAISKGRKEPAGDEDGAADLDESRLERAMASLAHEAGSLDDEDPKKAARFMRRLYETAGLPVAGGMDEALRRLEAGEDPEAIEAEMGDVLSDPFGGADGSEDGAGSAGAKALRRKLLPPRHDPELYEM